MAGPGLVDTRSFGRLESFAGKSEDYQDWAFKARAWILLLPNVDGIDIGGCLAAAGGNPGPINSASVSSAVDRFGARLYAAVLQAVSGRALSVAKSVEDSNGWGLWRRL